MEMILNFLGITLSAMGLLSPTIDYVFIKDKARRISLYLTSITLSLALVTLIFAIYTYPNQTILVYNGALSVDIYGIFLALVATMGSLLVVIASSTIRKWSTSPSFYSLILLGLLGVYYLIFVNDFDFKHIKKPTQKMRRIIDQNLDEAIMFRRLNDELSNELRSIEV